MPALPESDECITVSTHASVRRRPDTVRPQKKPKIVSTHASVRRRRLVSVCALRHHDVSTHASVRRRRRTNHISLTDKMVSTHASVRRRLQWLTSARRSISFNSRLREEATSRLLLPAS